MLDADLHVAVAIPTYNNEATIGDTFDMLVEQRRPPDRVVFCDKSTDDTRAVIERRRESAPFVVEILDQTGDGVADAYDQILDYVAGDYDLFVTLQSDLVVDEDWLAGHVEKHRENPDVGLVNGDGKFNDPTDREVDPDERPYYVGRNFSAKAGVLERIDGWDPNFLRGEDWDMRIRLAGAGVRSYACTALGYEWQRHDPYITFSKAKRRPTSLSFLAKYGTWYATFHPSHLVSDGLCLAAILGAVGTLAFLPVVPTLAALSALLFVLAVPAFWAGHVALRGGVDDDYLLGPVRKQLLNGVAVVYAAVRILRTDPDWNTTGFDPDEVPRYKF